MKVIILAGGMPSTLTDEREKPKVKNHKADQKEATT